MGGSSISSDELLELILPPLQQEGEAVGTGDLRSLFLTFLTHVPLWKL